MCSSKRRAKTCLQVMYSSNDSTEDGECLESNSDSRESSLLEETDGTAEQSLIFESAELTISEDEWVQTKRDIADFKFDESTSGIKLNLNNNTTPRQVFDKIFNSKMRNILVSSTNTYAANLSKKSPQTRNARHKQFQAINENELMKFLGLYLLNGHLGTPKIQSNFSTDPLYWHPIFPYTMSGRRFEQILRNLNVNPNIGDKNLDKVSSFVEEFKRSSRSA